MAISARPKRKRKRPYLTAEEAKKLLAAVKETSRNPERDYCLLLLMIRHGLRVSEACSLRLGDIELERKRFYIPRLKGCTSGEHIFYNGESTALKNWLVKRKQMNPPAELDTVFISERRRPLARNTVNLLIKIAAEAAGLAHLHVHPHMLRHTCGYLLVNKKDGPNLRVIQAYLGHRSISSTVRYTELDSKRFVGLF